MKGRRKNTYLNSAVPEAHEVNSHSLARGDGIYSKLFHEGRFRLAYAAFFTTSCLNHLSTANNRYIRNKLSIQLL